MSNATRKNFENHQTVIEQPCSPADSERRIVLVGTERRTLTPLAEKLEANGFQVILRTSPTIAISEIRRNPPALVLLGLKLRNVNGLDLVRRVSEIGSIPTAILTKGDDEFGTVIALRSGADDVIEETVSPVIFLERVRAILARNRTVSQDEQGDTKKLQVGPLSMDPMKCEVTWNGEIVDLTPTQFKVLHCIARRPGYVRTRDQITDAIYGYNFHITERTIDSHIKRIRMKLRTVNRSCDPIQTLYGIGYRLRIGKDKNL
tara:strand:+ start:1398 stop:2180 length:783 start_codon:yes stop_codon:yes gene_type:complete